jgi:hypothetical protein
VDNRHETFALSTWRPGADDLIAPAPPGVSGRVPTLRRCARTKTGRLCRAGRRVRFRVQWGTPIESRSPGVATTARRRYPARASWRRSVSGSRKGSEKAATGSRNLSCLDGYRDGQPESPGNGSTERNQAKPSIGLEPMTPSLPYRHGSLDLALVSRSWLRQNGLFASSIRRLGKSWGNPRPRSKLIGPFESAEVEKHHERFRQAYRAPADQAGQERSHARLLRLLARRGREAWPPAWTGAREGLGSPDTSGGHRLARRRRAEALLRASHSEGGWGWLEANPIAEIDSASTRAARRRILRRDDYFNAAELERLLEQASGDFEEAFWLCGAHAGLRLPGEALGLRWGAVDFQAGVIRPYDNWVRDRPDDTKTPGVRADPDDASSDSRAWARQTARVRHGGRRLRVRGRPRRPACLRTEHA